MHLADISKTFPSRSTGLPQTTLKTLSGCKPSGTRAPAVHAGRLLSRLQLLELARSWIMKPLGTYLSNKVSTAHWLITEVVNTTSITGGAGAAKAAGCQISTRTWSFTAPTLMQTTLMKQKKRRYAITIQTKLWAKSHNGRKSPLWTKWRRELLSIHSMSPSALANGAVIRQVSLQELVVAQASITLSLLLVTSCAIKKKKTTDLRPNQNAPSTSGGTAAKPLRHDAFKATALLTGLSKTPGVNTGELTASCISRSQTLQMPQTLALAASMRMPSGWLGHITTDSELHK